ncbi:MAG: SCO family protein [Bryobacteraceae bacterium]
MRFFLFLSAVALTAQERPSALKSVAFEQRLNEQAPLDLTFRDETGREVRLGEFFGSKPVVLAPVYYECPMLCTQILNGLVSSLRPVSFDPGKEFDVIAVSFDPRETPSLASAKKAGYMKRFQRPGTEAGFHFLTGNEASIKALMDSIGFRYAWDEKTQQFAHASGIVVLTPQGRISHYFYGIEYPSRDLRLGLVEASQNKIGSAVDQILLFCYHYDPATGTYGAMVMNMVRLAALATLLALGGFLLIMFRRDARGRVAQH